MHVRYMWVPVLHPWMPMRMHMRLARRVIRQVFMLMVGVVYVGVRVLHRLMLVLMLVVLGVFAFYLTAALVLGLPARFYVVTTAMYQMVSQYPPRFPTAAAMGVSLFAGEAEGRLHLVHEVRVARAYHWAARRHVDRHASLGRPLRGWA